MTLPHHLPIPELYVSPEAAAALARDAARLPGWTLEPRQRAELNLLLSGGFAPLRGYMTEAQHAAPLAAGWPVPLALAVSDTFAAGVQPGDDIALCDGARLAVAMLSVTDRWQAGPVLLGGKVKGLRRPDPGGPTPNAVRAQFRAQGAERVLAAQPAHQDHIAAAAELARRLDARLLVQALPGLAADGGDGAVLAPLPVGPPGGEAGALWAGLVARNHGATHVVLDADAGTLDLYRRHQEALGLPVAVPGAAR